MGWDAFSEPLTTDWNKGDPLWLPVAERVSKLGYGLDGLLEHGGLDCSLSAEMLQRAVGRTVWDEDGWTAAEVKLLAETADWDWDEYVPLDQMWAKVSAQAFLERCAELGRGIRFSF